jgi:surfactin synthase thioesterase subunit
MDEHSEKRPACTKQESPLIIMLPFSGGNAYSYIDIIKCLPAEINVLCPELPGRGILSDRPLIKNIDDLADHILLHYLRHTDLNRPYIFFGHSMGALLAYLLTCKILSKGWPAPLHLCVSGCGGPSLKRRGRSMFNLPSDQFRKEILEMGGTSAGVLSNDTLMDFLRTNSKVGF